MILSIFEELLQENGRLYKEEILNKHRDNETFKKVCYLALNPYIRFFVRKVPKEFAGNGTMTLDEALDGLQKLSNRELTGNSAVAYLENMFHSLTGRDAQVLKKVIDGDLKCGVQIKTVNKNWPGLVPGFEVQLAESYSEKKSPKDDFYMEPKLDGMRVIVLCDHNGAVSFLSRGGKEFETLDHLADDLKELYGSNGFMFDAEVISGSFQETTSAVKRKKSKGAEIFLYIFDGMTYDEFRDKNCPLNYEQRRQKLGQMFEGNSSAFLKLNESVKYNPSSGESREEFIERNFDDHHEAHGEGSIVKDAKGMYEFKRTSAWQKIKIEETIDVEITGYFRGTGKNANRLGGFFYMLDGVECRVGGGFTDKQREEFWELCENGEMIGDIIEILTNAKTDKGATRHSRFIALRTFKGEKA